MAPPTHSLQLFRDPSTPVSGELFPVAEPATLPSVVLSAEAPAALARAAAVDECAAARAPLLPAFRESGPHPHASEWTRAGAGRHRSWPVPSHRVFRGLLGEEPPAAAATTSLHAVAPIAKRTAPAARDRTPRRCPRAPTREMIREKSGSPKPARGSGRALPQ